MQMHKTKGKSTDKAPSMEMEYKYKPSIHLDSSNLEAIKDWEVGEEYMLLMKVKQTSKNEHETSDGKRTGASFDILEISSMGDDMNGKKKHSDRELAQLTSGSKFRKVMEEFGNGTLRSNGKTVTKKDQAFAIAVSEQEKANKGGSHNSKKSKSY